MAVEKIADVLKNGNGFIAFAVAGDPDFEKSVDNIVALAEAGADVVEIGIAFSDPVADGPEIMQADLRAFVAGSTTEKVFEMIVAVRERTDVPLVFLTYLNPVFKYGYTAFLSQMQALDVEGIIIPDMPLEEQDELVTLAENYQRSFVQLVTPTSMARIPKIVERAAGFIYVVSSLGTTGVRDEVGQLSAGLITEIKKYTDVPTAIGFGVHNPAQVKSLTEVAEAAIVGSGIVEIIAANPADATGLLRDYVRTMTASIKSEPLNR